MGKNDTFNFIDGLFGGFAQGFQQARDRQSQKDLQERKFGLQEQQLGFNERQIALQEQAARTKAERAQRSLKLLEPFLQQFLGSGESSTQPSTTPDPVDTAQAATQAIQQPAPQPRQETFLPSEFPTTPEGVGTTSVRDRTVSDLVATEGELNKLLKQSTVKKPVESLTPEDLTQIQAAISEIEKNPTSLKQLKQARRLKELLQQRDQQTQEAENLPQVIERISQDLNIAPESRFGLGTTPTPVPEVPAPQQPGVGLETVPPQDGVSEFPRFDAELQRVRRLQGLPSDFKVSGKDAGLPFDFSVVPDKKQALLFLKRQFIEDQREERGISKFDILKFRDLLQDAGISFTADFQKDLEVEFREQFREGTSSRALAHFKVGERGTRKSEFLRDLAAKFGFIPKNLEAQANLPLAGDRIEVIVKLGNDAKSDRPITQVGFALKDDPTDIIFIGEPTTAGAGAQITVKNLPQIPGTLLSAITQSKLALRSVARIDDILKRVDLDSLVGPIDAPIATLLEALGFPNADQQTIGNITRDLTDSLGRMRSGGVISEQEWETFMALVPQRSDPALTFVNKLNDFRAKMNDIVSVNLEAARVFGFNVGTSDADVNRGSSSSGSSKLQQLLEEKARRAGTGG